MYFLSLTSIDEEYFTSTPSTGNYPDATEIVWGMCIAPASIFRLYPVYASSSYGVHPVIEVLRTKLS